MKKLLGVLVLMGAVGNVAAQQDTTGPAHAAALAYWTGDYAAAELAGVRCAAPSLPLEARTAAVERDTAKAIQAWEDCHRRLMGALAPEAAHNYIPADLHAAMTPAERAAATRHVAAVHARLAGALQADAAGLIAAHQAWHAANQRQRDEYRERVYNAAQADHADRQEAARQDQIARSR